MDPTTSTHANGAIRTSRSGAPQLLPGIRIHFQGTMTRQDSQGGKRYTADQSESPPDRDPRQLTQGRPNIPHPAHTDDESSPCEQPGHMSRSRRSDAPTPPKPTLSPPPPGLTTHPGVQSPTPHEFHQTKLEQHGPGRQYSAQDGATPSASLPASSTTPPPTGEPNAARWPSGGGLGQNPTPGERFGWCTGILRYQPARRVGACSAHAAGPKQLAADFNGQAGGGFCGMNRTAQDLGR